MDGAQAEVGQQEEFDNAKRIEAWKRTWRIYSTSKEIIEEQREQSDVYPEVHPEGFLWFSSGGSKESFEKNSPHIEPENGGYLEPSTGLHGASGLWTMTCPTDNDAQNNPSAWSTIPDGRREIMVIAPLAYFTDDPDAPDRSSSGPTFKRGRFILVAKRDAVVTVIDEGKVMKRYFNRYFVVPERYTEAYFQAIGREPGVVTLPLREVTYEKPSLQINENHKLLREIQEEHSKESILTNALWEKLNSIHVEPKGPVEKE